MIQIFKSSILFSLIFSLLLPEISEGEISCVSCNQDFCSSITQIGSVSGSKIYSTEITISCKNCAGNTMRIAFDDSYGKRYIKEEQINQDGEINYKLDLQNFFISDGVILISFELSSTGTSGYTVISELSCQLIYDDYPKAPSGIQAIPKESAFSVRWNKHIDRDINKFRLYFGFPESCSSENIETSTYEVSITYVSGEKVKNGAKYCGFVQAIDNGGKISPNSETFYVIPAKTFKFTEAEEFGCIIANIFGESKITYYLRAIRDLLLKIPGGKFLVRAYYRLSHYIIKAFRKEAFAYDSIAFIGAGITTFNKLGIFQGQNLFQLAYGKKIILADILIGRKIINQVPIFISFRLNPSILQGKRLIFSDSGEIIATDEKFSTLIMMPASVGPTLFLDFLEEQIFVPNLGIFFSGYFVFESYPDSSKIGVVFGPSLSFGANILLDPLDRRSESIAKSEYGIENSYLFVNGTFSNINLIRRGLSLKRSNYFDFSSFYISGGVSFCF